MARNLIGWRVSYDDGREFSSKETEWKDIPADGILAVMEFYDDGSKQCHHSKDHYVLDDGKAYGTNDIGPYLRKQGQVKFGRWSKDSDFNRFLTQAQQKPF